MKPMVLLLAMILLASMLTGCAPKTIEPDDDINPVATAQPAPPVQPAPTDPATQDENETSTGPEEPVRAFNENWKIAIVTQLPWGDEYNSAKELITKYGEDRIIHAIWPISHEEQLSIDVLGNIAADPDIKAIILQGSLYSGVAIDRARELRGDDIFIAAFNQYENVEVIAAKVDLILQVSNELTAELTAVQAKTMGADTIGFYSFERHLEIPTVVQRRERMKTKAEELGMKFVDLDAPDPIRSSTSETQQFLTEDVPRQVAELGVNTAFYGTHCAMQAPLQRQVVQTGTLYPIPCCPSPFHRFPEVFNIPERQGTGEFAQNPEGPEGDYIEITEPRDTISFVDDLRAAIAAEGATGRLSTWPIWDTVMWQALGTMYAIEWIHGRAPQEPGVIDLDLLNTLAEDYTESLYGERIGIVSTPLEHNGTLYPHWITSAMHFLLL